MRKQLIVVVIAVLAVFSLTGCLRYRAEGRIGTNGLVSGSVVIGYDREFVKHQPGQGVYDDLSRFMKANAASVSRGKASVEPLDEGEFRGFRTTFTDVALTDFVQLMRHEEVRPGENGGLDLRLTRQGDEYVFDAQVVTGPNQIPIPPDALRRIELVVSLTFPGPVVSSNGTVSDHTVTWHPVLTDPPHLTATGKIAQPADDPADGRDDAGPANDSGGVPAGLVAAAIAVTAAAALGLALVLRRRSRA